VVGKEYSGALDLTDLSGEIMIFVEQQLLRRPRPLVLSLDN
jgi:hypothetical protein